MQSQNEARHPPRIRAQDARGGEIILRNRKFRLIFMVGLVAMVVLAAVGTLAVWGAAA